MNKKPLIIKLKNLAKSVHSTNINESDLVVERKTIIDYFPLHRHEFIELEFVLSGSGFMLLNGKKIDIEKGLFYLLRPSDFHEFFLTSKTEIVTISFDYSLFPYSLIRYFYLTNGVFLSVARDKSFDEINNLIDLFEYEYNNSYHLKTVIMRDTLSILLTYLLRLTDLGKSKQNLSDHISSALNYINFNFSNNPSLTEVANFVNLNPSYFSALFKQEMQKTYSKYLIDLKLSYAKKLLKTSNMTVIQICYDCGFNSISNFSRTFHNQFGCAPLQYRNDNQK